MDFKLKINKLEIRAASFWDWKSFGVGARYDHHNKGLFIEILFWNLDFWFGEQPWIPTELR